MQILNKIDLIVYSLFTEWSPFHVISKRMYCAYEGRELASGWTYGQRETNSCI